MKNICLTVTLSEPMIIESFTVAPSPNPCSHANYCAFDLAYLFLQSHRSFQVRQRDENIKTLSISNILSQYLIFPISNQSMRQILMESVDWRISVVEAATKRFQFVVVSGEPNLSATLKEIYWLKFLALLLFEVYDLCIVGFLCAFIYVLQNA